MVMLISSKERCGPNWQHALSELYFLILGVNISTLLIGKFTEVSMNSRLFIEIPPILVHGSTTVLLALSKLNLLFKNTS